MEHYYNDFGTWIRRQFPFRVQKISVDAGFSCPNRDGRISYGGCTFCDNHTFNPSYCSRERSVSQQIADGKAFFARKYPDMRYLAYFQAYSNTYAPVDTLRALYEETLAVPGVVGLVIGTRPDCVSAEVLDYIGQLSRRTFVLVEYGIESADDDTLRRINRGHTFADSRRAIVESHRRGILTEGREELLRQAAAISALPLDILKIHQMQIIRGTALARQFADSPFHVFSVDEYISLVSEYIQRLRPDLVLERFVSQSPAAMLVAPRWGLKNHEFTDRLNRYLCAHGIRQGSRVV